MTGVSTGATIDPSAPADGLAGSGEMTTVHDPSVLTDLPGEVFRPLRRVEYEAMVQVGLFDDSRVELIGEC